MTKPLLMILTAAVCVAACNREDSNDVTPADAAESRVLTPKPSTVKTRPPTRPTVETPPSNSPTPVPPVLQQDEAGTSAPEVAAAQSPGVTPEFATPAATPPVASLTPALPAITPVGDSESARNLAQMGATPSSSTVPEILRTEPKEFDRSGSEPFAIMGFNLAGSRVFALDQTGQEVELASQETSREQLTVEGSQFQKLPAGTYTIEVRGPNGSARLKHTIELQ